MLILGKFDAIYDVTVAYPDALPVEPSAFILGYVPREVHFLIKRYPASRLPLSLLQDSSPGSNLRSSSVLSQSDIASDKFSAGQSAFSGIQPIDEHDGPSADVHSRIRGNRYLPGASETLLGPEPYCLLATDTESTNLSLSSNCSLMHSSRENFTNPKQQNQLLTDNQDLDNNQVHPKRPKKQFRKCSARGLYAGEQLGHWLHSIWMNKEAELIRYYGNAFHWSFPYI
ncbi:unnamed protein product [Protopolystoma xenopodis]|uniref:Uncharacterized protein n=1 Tax=Protopolystoma xenopodis TaxID=117903 RepID=A0A3S5A7R7_9PLAT|nr:unnamed protein product [Protopolystoma xenopodis]